MTEARPPAPDDADPRQGRVDILVMPEHRLAVLRLLGEVTVPGFLAAIGKALGENPEAAAFHVISDLRAHTGNLGVEGIKAGTGLRLAAWPERVPSREVLLSRDPGMVFIARYLDLLAPHVAHSVAADAAAALATATGGTVPPDALAFLGG